MKRTGKFIALLLAVLMMFSVLPIGAMASDSHPYDGATPKTWCIYERSTHYITAETKWVADGFLQGHYELKTGSALECQNNESQSNLTAFKLKGVDNASGYYYITIIYDGTTYYLDGYAELTKDVSKAAKVTVRSNGQLWNGYDVLCIKSTTRSCKLEFTQYDIDKKTPVTVDVIKNYTVAYTWTNAPEGAVKPSDNSLYSSEALARESVDTTYKSGDKITAGGYTYTFSGWTASVSGTVVTFTGSWSKSADSYTVTYEWTGLEGKLYNDKGEEITLSAPAGGTYTVENPHTKDTTVYPAVYNLDQYGNRTAVYTFSGWGEDADPSANVKYTGTWTKTDVTVPTHKVTYTVSGTAPEGYTVPTDNGSYVKGQDYTVAGVPADVEVKDAYNNVTARYTFDGWYNGQTKVSGKQTMGDADVTLTGVWAKTDVTVPTHKVTYTVSGTAPEGYAVPTDNGSYVKGQDYTVAGVPADVEVKDAYNNVIGTWTFSGWWNGNSIVSGKQTMGDADVTLTGAWTYNKADVKEFTVSYEWTNAPSTVKLPTDGGKYVTGASYTVDGEYVEGSFVKVYGGVGATEEIGRYTFSGWYNGQTKVSGKQTMGSANVVLKGEWTYTSTVKKTLTINYVYGDGTKAAESYIAQLAEGQEYNVASPALAGCTVDKAAVSGRMGTGAQYNDVTVTVTYTRYIYSIDLTKVVKTAAYSEKPAVNTKFVFKVDDRSGRWDKTIASTEMRAGDGYILVDTSKTTADKLYLYEVNASDNNWTFDTTEYILTFDGTNYYVTKNVRRAPTVKNGTASFENLYNRSAIINGNVKLTKVDGNDVKTTLSGAKFALYNYKTGSYIGQYTTNKYGVIDLALSEGDYYFTETASPAGYTRDTTYIYFSVVKGKTTELTVKNYRTGTPGDLNGIDHYAYVVGYPDGTVRPQNNVTRAEVATIFFRLLTEDVRNRNMTKVNSFTDVNDGDWYCTAVSTLAKMGIVNGYADGTFDPNGNITRAEFAAIAARFEKNGNTTAADFSDVYGHWATKEISIAANNGWVLGYEDGTFQPNRLITRAEAMTLINRVLNRVPETTNDLLKGMTTFSDNANTNAWYYIAVQEATNSHDFNRKLNGYEYWTQLRTNRDWTLLEK